MITIDLHPDDRKVRQFALAAAVFLVASEVKRGAWIAAGCALVLALVGYTAPRLVRPLYVAASVVTFPIGWAISHLALALLYYVVMTPIGFGLRIGGRDRLRLKRPQASECGTYWVTRDELAPPERYLRQF